MEALPFIVPFASLVVETLLYGALDLLLYRHAVCSSGKILRRHLPYYGHQHILGFDPTQSHIGIWTY
jgi:hypothetical protein